MSEGPIFRCSLCPHGEEFESDNKTSVKKHISHKDSGRHQGKKGAESDEHIEEVPRNEIETLKANERVSHEGEEQTEITVGNRRYVGRTEGIDGTMQPISERPYSDPAGVLDESATFFVRLDDSDIIEILNADIPKELREKLFKQVMEKEDDGNQN
jgi:hypothetical protein